MSHDPFAIGNPQRSLLTRAAAVAARPLLTPLLGLNTYRELYRELDSAPGHDFLSRALTALDIEVACTPHDLMHVPPTGALIVAANHPHGLLDGLAVGSLVSRVRYDVRVLTNMWLSRLPELHEVCFFVDPFGGPRGAARSRAGLRAAHLWLQRGGTLVIFPSGEVAHDRREDGTPVDGPWSPSVARLAAGTGARVVPARIIGSNSAVFYEAGRVHPRLRTLLLPRELLKKRGQTVRVSFGGAIAPGALMRDGQAGATERIRKAVEQLSSARDGAQPERLRDEVASLPAECRLLSMPDIDVYCTDARSIPSTLREIGRLRETAFRAVGEGTGRQVDIDRFDEHYLHLFAWDRRRQQVIGAYRIGRTDRILATRGPEGLYTRTLFNFDESLLARLSPALELGRSFVRTEYQRNYAALLSLWKGVARYVALHPRYRVLFGPVSISGRYSDMSQRLLMRFLEHNHRQSDLAALVTPTNPASVLSTPVLAPPQSIRDLDQLIARSEPDGKGVPVLLRQYLKLNARLLGFNVDPAFGDVLDALMMVDLTAVDRSILNRYFGRREAAAFLAHHTAQAA
jgi:putative hemolysin